MLDIKFIREHADIVKEGAAKKHVKVDIDRLLTLDTQRIDLQQKMDTMRADQNEAGKRIAQLPAEEKQEAIVAMASLKEALQALEETDRKVMEEWKEIMYQVPNVPDLSVPEGKEDSENVEIKVVGEKQQFDFEPKDHMELMQNLTLADFERGVKVHGFRGYFLRGAGARLQFALWQYAVDFFTARGLELLMTPTIARPDNFYGTGHLPNEAEDIFKTQDGDYLTGTAEVSAMGYYADEILEDADFPVKFLGFSSCYRREVGSHGKDTKGLIRVHEFHKLEQVILCKASHATSVEWHEWLTQNAEEFLQSLGLTYHVVLNCGGDLGLGQVKKYDIECWVPSQENYRETHSSSYFHDFQTRRFNIRYRDTDGTIQYAHSLNNTAVATPRILAPLVEQNQNADGSITIPDVLRPYMGGQDCIVKES